MRFQEHEASVTIVEFAVHITERSARFVVLHLWGEDGLERRSIGEQRAFEAKQRMLYRGSDDLRSPYLK
jgi:hypothetical protein